MPKIAVVQDGTEQARQAYADIAGWFEWCCEVLSQDGTEFTLQTFTDDGVASLLDRINRLEYACVVFASNAMLSSQVERAVLQQRDHLEAYLASGGGLVILHQLRDTLDALLPDDLCPVVHDRTSPRGPRRAVAYDSSDVLLHYPLTVDTNGQYDGGTPAGPPSLFYKALELDEMPNGLKPVLTYGNEVILARTYDHLPARVVVATGPLDWQRSTELLVNAVRFASLGQPHRLIWRPDNRMARRPMSRWISVDGRASVRPVPSPADPVGDVDRWLMAHVDMIVCPDDQFEAVQRRPDTVAFLSRGGALISHDRAAGLGASHVTAVVGNHIERALAAQLYGELRAVEGWQTVQYAFELRNIVTALALLQEDVANRSKGAVRIAEVAWLIDHISNRLHDSSHREDLSSSIALAQTYFLLNDGRLGAGLVEWMHRDPRRLQPDVGFQIHAIGTLTRKDSDSEIIAHAVSALSEAGSLGPLVRVLDTVALLDQVRLLGDPPTADLAALAERVCDLLEEYPPQLAVGWLSVEATADVARGLVVLLGRLPESHPDLIARMVDHLGLCLATLHGSIRRYERNPKGAAWLARLSNALIVTERRFPDGLQRLATLTWPEREQETLMSAGVAASLLEHLAAENKTLRADADQHRKQRLAARVGRGFATTLAVLAVLVPFAWVLTLVSFSSVWEIVGNLALIVSAFLGFIAGAFALLARWDLLAGPADALRDWIGDTVPLARALLRRDRPQ